jgi:hypothetical protein
LWYRSTLLVKFIYKQSLGKCSYQHARKERFGRNRLLIDWWIREAGLLTEEPAIDGEIKEIEFDEMWHFIESKKENIGSSKPLIIAAGKLSHGFSAVVIAQRSDDGYVPNLLKRTCENIKKAGFCDINQ